jgi:hypothetical protein
MPHDILHDKVPEEVLDVRGEAYILYEDERGNHHRDLLVDSCDLWAAR